MQTARKLFGVVLVIAAGLLIAMAAAQSGRPTSVATIRVGKVIDGLDQWKAAEAELNSMQARIESLDQETKTLVAQLDAERESVKDADLEKRTQLEERILEESFEYRAQKQALIQRYDRESTLFLQQIDEAIKQELKRLCEAQGYDIVMVDDSQRELALSRDVPLSRREQILQQMTSRRLVYVNESVVDITNELIVRMNNAFAAGNGR